ncbi:hypothetical protein OIU92_01450 [Escherichia coli]|nr:hypothetical protein [Escherichia coli]
MMIRRRCDAIRNRAYRCGPPRTAILRIWSCALSLAAAVSAFRHWQAGQLADCALSSGDLAGRDRLRHLEPLRSITNNWRHCWRTSWKHPYRLTRRFTRRALAWGAGGV